MKKPLSFFIFWCFLLSDLVHARNHHVFPPILAPGLPPQIPNISPISPASESMAAAPFGLQIGVHGDRHHHHHQLRKKWVLLTAIASIVPCVIIFCLFALIIWSAICRKANQRNVQSSETTKGTTLGPFLSKFNSLRMNGKKGSVSVIEYAFLEASTNNFSSSNILGEGGSGRIYKARFDDNILAAVKKLDSVGPESEHEFENEVDLMSKIRHPNLVSLLGYCVYGQSRFLVYELMQNGSLESQLHGPSRGSGLTWHLRMKIALDAARGLEYLHEHCNPPVIHRDLKSSNILLDSAFNAKLADFGLAVTVGAQSKTNVKLSGTLGYVAPEYLLDGKLTEKSDVYSFGVVLLELLMGRKPVEKLAPAQCQSIVTWAMPQLTDRSKLPNIVDPVIKNTMDLKHLYQVAAVAVLCVQPEPSYRPLITDVLHSLIPLVPIELGGALRVSEPKPTSSQ
ncbi:hypothetical protein AMTRI_Chr12g270980 [Amborella trichopoda]|uniref:Protein kinase domain-containing protein n=1 Tax=Amborella trichopoda TaxID=13333 RepID=W1PQM3_AMBTC|nr:probable receptor-like protein kinase At1g80640 [Amborella trichopoda]ERN10358.1 hypothetical protein AMTR_s00026p00089830 [Amborella trichopoda]|eukprot:XP_006848777.1 probable receptor-like protein kinase At1g80640 [Amborella trichopoda]